MFDLGDLSSVARTQCWSVKDYEWEPVRSYFLHFTQITSHLGSTKEIRCIRQLAMFYQRNGQRYEISKLTEPEIQHSIEHKEI